MSRVLLGSLLLAATAACADAGTAADGGPPIDGAVRDAPGAAIDASSPGPDGGGGGDAALPIDGAVPPPPDAAVPSPPDAAVPLPPDAGTTGEQHMHISIDNFCNTSVSPGEVSVPNGATVQLTWHNHSVDYDADVWLSYGGGYLGLVTGGIWADQFDFCAGPGPYEAGADVSIAGGPSSGCPGFHVAIHCL